jgi:hypothetical protein
MFCALAQILDLIAYDKTSNRYSLPARHWVTSATAAASGFTPEMAIADGVSRAIIAEVDVGIGAHSVAIDRPSDQVYVPFQVLQGVTERRYLGVHTAGRLTGSR